MNPIDIIFQSISQMTGGLINDLVTAIVAMVALSFIAMGADFLLSIFQTNMQRRESSKFQQGLVNDVMSSYKNLDDLRYDPKVSVTQRDMAKAPYQNSLSRYARGRIPNEDWDD